MVESTTIHLRAPARVGSVQAELRDAIETQQLVDWEQFWRPALAEVLADLDRRGVPRSAWPQSRHWNWKEKAEQVYGVLAYRGFCVIADGQTQGLAQIDLNRFARLPEQSGKPLVHVDYLEVAPWNRPELGQPPRFRGVGSALIAASVQLSLDEGFKGRIGLHSVPQADDFYRRCGMSDFGPDPQCQNLRYFEMTVEQARAFLEEE